MILLSSLKKTIIVSIIGHITVFSIFGLSFGNRIPRAEYNCVYFWGQFLRNSQVIQPITTGPGLRKPDKISSDSAFVSRYYFPAKAGSRLILSGRWEKPSFILAFNSEKEPLAEKPTSRLFTPKGAEPSIIFHPLLPYGFSLYFNDRQVAHVELMFKMVSAGTRNSILIKRKISSGNLEVDLLTMRYIGHYLFIQQSSIFANNWQTVKIDLSAKDK